jgi:hypothetical protein
MFYLSELYKSFTSKPLKRLVRTKKRRRASVMDRLMNWFVGRASEHSQAPKAPQIANQSDVKLVLIGDGSRMSGIKGTTSSVPWAEVRRRFAQRGRNEGFMVLPNDEHCTSIKSACCGVRNIKAYDNKNKNYRFVRKDGALRVSRSKARRRAAARRRGFLALLVLDQPHEPARAELEHGQRDAEQREERGGGGRRRRARVARARTHDGAHVHDDRNDDADRRIEQRARSLHIVPDHQ